MEIGLAFCIAGTRTVWITELPSIRMSGAFPKPWFVPEERTVGTITDGNMPPTESERQKECLSELF